ncbi:MAG: ABC transporter permease, partial [Proteobacteria bacterium]|nr:ABC transporter permease [Pseudomonadota bacterium]
MRPSSLRLFAIGGREWALLGAVILASIVFSVASPYFATAGNAATIVRNSTELMLAGLGMTLLLAMGSIDVSIGILMGLA